MAKRRSDPAAALPREQVRRTRRRLLAHYDRTKRDLPWRHTSDAYAIWISEVMLQQTRVETVRQRWQRFLDRFPDVAALATASEQDVLKEWEGLGYYSRARNLRRAARALRDSCGARLPATVTELRALPGFGPYTAAAVASIAYGQREAVVDGNVARVLSRFLNEGGDVRRAAVHRRLQAAAQALVPRARPGDWNQALMELGATVCTPRGPGCEICPLHSDCLAFRQGNPEDLPRKGPRKAVPHHDIAAALVWRGERLLIARRPSDGLLGGLWEFPGGKCRPDETLEEACVREVREETGLDVRVQSTFLTLNHAYSHFRITLHLFHCLGPRGRPRPLGCEEPRFVHVHELDDFAFPRANRRAIEALTASGGAARPTGRP